MGFLSRLTGIRVEPVATAQHASPASLESLRVATALQGMYPTSEQAASIPAVYRAAQILQDLPATLPLRAWRGGKNSDQALARGPELVETTPELLLDPSPYMNRDDVIRMGVGSLFWRGNAHFHLQLHGAGVPRFATPVNPDEVSVTWNEARTKPVISWRGQTMTQGVDWLHVYMPRPLGSPAGLGPIDATRLVLAGVVAVNEWGRDLFTDAAVPSGTLNVPGKLVGEEPQDLLDDWEAAHRNGRRTAVLSGGITYEAVSMTPEQAQFLMTRAFGIQEVSRLTGVPAHFLNAGNPPQSSSSLTYTNVTALFKELTTVTLYPSYLRRLEKAFSSLLPRGMTAQFDLSDLLKADDGTRYGALKTAIDAGIITVNEARGMEDLSPLDTPPPPQAPADDPIPVPDESELENAS